VPRVTPALKPPLNPLGRAQGRRHDTAIAVIIAASRTRCAVRRDDRRSADHAAAYRLLSEHAQEQ
jgi:hypothetical protein